jgi:DNA uptake protein ComE-like DNA-binding protein
VAPPAQGSASAAGRVDLNSASVEELNAIPGAGLIGRAIQRGRPYASPEDLVAKRILNRAAYERIKDQITAQ